MAVYKNTIIFVTIFLMVCNRQDSLGNPANRPLDYSSEYYDYGSFENDPESRMHQDVLKLAVNYVDSLFGVTGTIPYIVDNNKDPVRVQYQREEPLSLESSVIPEYGTLLPPSNYGYNTIVPKKYGNKDLETAPAYSVNTQSQHLYLSNGTDLHIFLTEQKRIPIVIKNAYTQNFVWVRKDKGSSKIMLTLDPHHRSEYFITPKPSTILEVISKERVCVQGDLMKNQKVSATPCKKYGMGTKWDLVPVLPKHFWIRLSGTNSCMQPEVTITSLPVLVEMNDCDMYDARQLWEIEVVK